MRIPAVLSTVHVTIDADGHLTINVDGEPPPAARELARGDLQSVLDEITAEFGTAVRVEVREYDGTTYSDIITPPAGDTTPVPEVPPAAPPSGLSGRGFHPGEEVAVAYVICTQTAGADGRTAIQVPPALLLRSGVKMLLVGMTSAAVATIEPT